MYRGTSTALTPSLPLLPLLPLFFRHRSQTRLFYYYLCFMLLRLVTLSLGVIYLLRFTRLRKFSNKTCFTLFMFYVFLAVYSTWLIK